MVTTVSRPPAGIALRGLEKRFGDVVAVHPLDLEIAPGEFVVFVGPSGCGKTTVLRMIAGLDDPSAGAVWIGGRAVEHVEPADRDVAMVFQSYALYPHMTVRENLAFGLRMRKHAAADIERRVSRAAGVLGLEALMERRPGQLSGGQKQRVAFGRAMVRDPQVFLFDEPLSNLDARLRADMRREIAELHARLGATMLYVTHDQVEAMTLGQRIAVMRDGRLQQYAPPLEVYRQPANLYVATFIGTPAINLVTGDIVAPAQAAGRAEPSPRLVAGRLSLPLASRQSASRRVTIGVRAENLRVVPPGDSDFTSVVHRVERLGNESLVHLDGPLDDPWIARAAADWAGRAGDAVGVRLDRQHTLWFDAGDGRRLG
jgi:ABC-type sugar transport system ATPase subunit